MQLNADQRVISIAALCSMIVVIAGLCALLGVHGVQIASALLTLAAILAFTGFPWARNRKVGRGIAVLVAAVLPTFGALYAVGSFILRQMGSTAAGGLLVATGTLFMCWTGWYSAKLRKPRAPLAH